MATDFDIAASELRIQTVNMMGCNIALKKDMDPEILRHTNFQIQGIYGVHQIAEDEHIGNDQSSLWRYRFIFLSIMRAIPEGIEAEISEEVDFYVKIEAEFCASYLSNNKLTQEQQSAYVMNKNVDYHVWPFWREFVQSTCNRLGIPAIPVHHIHCKNQQPSATSDS